MDAKKNINEYVNYLCELGFSNNVLIKINSNKILIHIKRNNKSFDEDYKLLCKEIVESNLQVSVYHKKKFLMVVCDFIDNFYSETFKSPKNLKRSFRKTYIAGRKLGKGKEE